MIPHHLYLFVSVLSATVAMAGTAQIATIDSRITRGTWAGYSDAGVQLRTDQGIVTIAATQLSDIVFDSLDADAAPRDARPSRVPQPDAPHRFELADGASLHGTLVDGDESGVLARTALGGQTRFRFHDLAAIVFRINADITEADALVQAALAERRAGRDLLVTADDQPKSIPGTLLSLDADGGTFRFGTRDRRFRRQKIHAIVFARPATPPPPPLHRLTLRNGDTIAGELLGGDESLLTLAAYGQSVELPVDQIRAIAVRNPRVTYLADLEPIAVDDEGLVHRGWSYRRNRNVGNRPLRLAGRVYPRGLGVHARSSLTYMLDGAFDQFAATIGIDDAVGEGGLVAFVVQVDGQERYRSPTLRGAQEPTAIMLDVKGGQTITLTVEFAGNADIGDWANWADARLIRPQ